MTFMNLIIICCNICTYCCLCIHTPANIFPQRELLIWQNLKVSMASLIFNENYNSRDFLLLSCTIIQMSSKLVDGFILSYSLYAIAKPNLLWELYSFLKILLLSCTIVWMSSKKLRVLSLPCSLLVVIVFAASDASTATGLSVYLPFLY